MKKTLSLIELFVVIAIIAILAAILFPVFAQVRISDAGSTNVESTRIRLSPLDFTDSVTYLQPVIRLSERLGGHSRIGYKAALAFEQTFGQVEVEPSVAAQGLGFTAAAVGAWLVSSVLKKRNVTLFVVGKTGNAWPNGYARCSTGKKYVVSEGELVMSAPINGQVEIQLFVGDGQLEIETDEGWVDTYHVSANCNEATIIVRRKTSGSNV